MCILYVLNVSEASPYRMCIGLQIQGPFINFRASQITICTCISFLHKLCITSIVLSYDVVNISLDTAKKDSVSNDFLRINTHHKIETHDRELK